MTGTYLGLAACAEFRLVPKATLMHHHLLICLTNAVGLWTRSGCPLLSPSLFRTFPPGRAALAAADLLSRRPMVKRQRFALETLALAFNQSVHQLAPNASYSPPPGTLCTVNIHLTGVTVWLTTAISCHAFHCAPSNKPHRHPSLPPALSSALCSASCHALSTRHLPDCKHSSRIGRPFRGSLVPV